MDMVGRKDPALGASHPIVRPNAGKSGEATWLFQRSRVLAWHPIAERRKRRMDGGLALPSRLGAILKLELGGMKSSHLMTVKLSATTKFTYLKHCEVFWKELMHEDPFGH